MAERGVEFKVGLLIVTAVAIFVGFIFVLGNFSLSSGFTIYVDYKFSGNIQSGAPVKVSGIKVGKVKEVLFLGGKIDPVTKQRVQVRLEVWVEDRVRDTIRSDAEFFINTTGVLGEQYLEIVPGDDFDNPPLEIGTVVRGIDPPRTDLIVARLYDVLDSLGRVLKDDRELISNLLKDGASAVSELNTLLRDNREELGNLIVSANQLAGETAGVLGKVNQGLGDPRVIARTIRHADALLVTADRTLSDLGPSAKRLMIDATRVTGLLTDKKLNKALKLADDAVLLTGKAGRLVDNVDGMVTDLRRGKGTAGALLVREEVYADLREMIRDLKRNPWKFFWKE